MKTEETTTAATPPPATGIYEVICHSIEIDGLICYRTHRLSLTKERADAILAHSPDSLRFVGA